MFRAALRFVGRDLPSQIDPFDVENYFSLSSEDVEAICSSFRKHQFLVGLQLTVLRATGQLLDRNGRIPNSLLRSFGQLFNARSVDIATPRAIYKDGQSTLYSHQKWVKEHTGFIDLDDSGVAQLRSYLDTVAIGATDVDQLVREAAYWLFDRKVIIPGDRRLRDIARASLSKVESEALSTIEAFLPAGQWRNLLSSLYERLPENGNSRIEWLKQRAGKHTKTRIDEIKDRIDFLRTLGVQDWSMEPFTFDFLRARAQSFGGRPPAHSRNRIEQTQILEAVCFLKVTLAELTDDFLYRTSRRVMDVCRSAEARSLKARLETQKDANDLVKRFRTVIDDDTRSAEDRLQALRQMIHEFDVMVTQSKAQSLRAALAGDEGMLRNLMHQVTSMKFSGKETDPGLSQLRMLKTLYDKGLTELPKDLEAPTHAKWQDHIEVDDRKSAFKAFEAATMLAWRTSLRRGSVWVEHSRSFKDRDGLLIPLDDWQANRDQYLGLLGLPLSAKDYLKRLRAQVSAGLEAVAEAVRTGAIGIENGKLSLPQLEAIELEAEAASVKKLIFNRIGEVQLPDLLVETDALCGFSQALLGRKARDERELTALYGALVGLATGRTAKAVAKMLPGVEVAHISSAMRTIEFPGRLRRANQALLDFHRTIPLMRCYGDGTSGSADMMSVAASQHLAKSRTDPRMRTWAVGMYTHVLDTWGIVYDQPLVLMERQGAPAVHGVQMYNAELQGTDRLRLDILAVDTHGYTAISMAVAKLLGFDLCPRLHSSAERKLYVPTRLDTPDELRDVVDPSVVERHIEEGWELLLRLCASIKTGRTTALLALQRLGSAAHGDALHKAGDALGKLLRTVYLCDFFTVKEFRREILVLLNRGESSHALERDLGHAPIRHDRGRRQDELDAISGSLALLTNIVLGWNMWKMNECRQHLASKKMVLDDAWMRRISPAASGHINANGLWSFSFANVRDALIQSERSKSHLAKPGLAG